MNQYETAIAELRAELTAQRHEIERQRTVIQVLEAQLARPHSRPKPVLPNPDKFTGSAQKYDTWLPSIKAKLRVDADAIGDSIAQFYYVYLNLESSVQAMVLPQLNEAESSTSWDYTTILDQLARVYDNPNKTHEAEDRLYALKQAPTETVPQFVAKFERVLYEANGQSWPDTNKISIFRNSLNSHLRNRLSNQLSLPRTYPEFVRITQQLATRSYHSEGQSNTNPNAMDLSAVDIHHLSMADSESDDESLINEWYNTFLRLLPTIYAPLHFSFVKSYQIFCTLGGQAFLSGG